MVPPAAYATKQKASPYSRRAGGSQGCMSTHQTMACRCRSLAVARQTIARMNTEVAATSSRGVGHQQALVMARKSGGRAGCTVRSVAVLNGIQQYCSGSCAPTLWHAQLHRASPTCLASLRGRQLWRHPGRWWPVQAAVRCLQNWHLHAEQMYKNETGVPWTGRRG